MSSGGVHLKASLILAAGFSAGAIVSQDSRLLECAVGALTGIFVSPDLDLNNLGIVQGKFLRKRVGWFGEKLWKFFWSGYAGSFKHGKFASHFPIFSTIVRLLYAYFWLIFVPHSLIKLLASPNWDLMYVLQWYATLFLSPMFFIGLASSDFIHFALDGATTAHSPKIHSKSLSSVPVVKVNILQQVSEEKKRGN